MEVKTFESLRNEYFAAQTEKEKRTILRCMSNVAISFEDWLFVFGHSIEKQIHYKSEKKILQKADTVSNLVIIVQNYNLTRRSEISAIEKTLAIASDDELRNLKQLCAEKGMMIEYLNEKANRAMNAACR